jgi:hypothetical protein
MKSHKFRSILIAGIVLASGAVAFGHHLAVGLSSVFGTEVMTEIVYFSHSDNLGVPAYRVGVDSHTVSLPDGAQFAVSDGSGATELVTFTTGLFTDPAQVDLEDVAEAINAQLTLGVALVDNDTLVLRGVEGGSAASLSLADGPGAPLATLGLLPGTVQGADDVQLVLSIPASDDYADSHEGGGLAHHPYLVVMSATDGVTPVAGFQVPIAIDFTTLMGLRATQMGAFPGSIGELDENEDAQSTFDTALLSKMYPQGLPDRLYFTFVVFGENLDSIEYVSNAFDVVIED